ncbi:tRNA-uridine aminocarboxypropyltransferase [Oceaniserpentilla sp. 4NH20-0058]
MVILQHPSEQKQALATVPILQMCLSPIEVLVGEDFSQLPIVSECLSRPDSCRVIFPSEQSEAWQSGQPVTDTEHIKTLIFIDGTWRKAKRIWHMNPWLSQLPSVRLEGQEASQYTIRSSRVQGSVSTLEAVALACELLDGSDQYSRLMKPFQAMIDMQIQRMGQAVFLSHYQKDD